MEISKHAKERYAERIMGKEEVCDINRFIIEHETKIKEDINKMITYGDLIYSGKQGKNDNNTDVYLKDTWIVLTDRNKSVVITLYKIDLGCGDEFNRVYIDKMMEKLINSKLVVNQLIAENQSNVNQYKDNIRQNIEQIKEFKTAINNLEKLNSDYNQLINDVNINVQLAEMDVKNVINTMIGRKEF